MAVSRPIIQQRLPFVDNQGRLSNEGLRALNDALGSLFDQINQIAQLYDLTDALNLGLAGVAGAPVALTAASPSFANGRVLVDGTAIGFTLAPGIITIGFDGSTTDVPEGTNLYYTLARVRAAVGGSATVTYDIGTGAFSITQANVITALGYTPVQSGGALALGIRTITAAPTFAATDYTLLCDASSTPIPISLPGAATVNGRIFVFKKVDASANAVTITPNGAETIDGAASLPITAQWARYAIQSNGAGWFVV